MKKILFLALSVMISLISYADTFSCKVPGFDSEVSVAQRSYTSNGIGAVDVTLTCSKQLSYGEGKYKMYKDATVLLNVYDGVTKKFVTSVNGTVDGITQKGYVRVNVAEKNHPYIIKIDDVSCD